MSTRRLLITKELIVCSQDESGVLAASFGRILAPAVPVANPESAIPAPLAMQSTPVQFSSTISCSVKHFVFIYVYFLLFLFICFYFSVVLHHYLLFNFSFKSILYYFLSYIIWFYICFFFHFCFFVHLVFFLQLFPMFSDFLLRFQCFGTRSMKGLMMKGPGLTNDLTYLL